MPGLKYDEGKPEFDRLSYEALGELNAVHKFGDGKYEKGNWKQGIEATRLLNAACRHIFKAMSGEMFDSESGLYHVAHAGVCCEMVIHFMKNPEQYKDFLSEISEEGDK